MARRHLHVGDDDVGAMRERLAQQIVGVTGLGHDVEARPRRADAGDSLAHEDVVLTDHHAHSAVTRQTVPRPTWRARYARRVRAGVAAARSGSSCFGDERAGPGVAELIGLAASGSVEVSTTRGRHGSAASSAGERDTVAVGQADVDQRRVRPEGERDVERRRDDSPPRATTSRPSAARTGARARGNGVVVDDEHGRGHRDR